MQLSISPTYRFTILSIDQDQGTTSSWLTDSHSTLLWEDLASLIGLRLMSVYFAMLQLQANSKYNNISICGFFYI